MTERAIRNHGTDYMHGLHELAGVTEPVAVVIRPDGSLDVFGQVGIVDQQTVSDRPYTWIVGQNRYLHEHRYSGQVLRHSHPDGERDHGYYEHPEDIPAR